MTSSSGPSQTVHAGGGAAKLMPNKTPQIEYDVFVSFRGEDIRHGFLSHLTNAFARKKINTFVDDKLKSGEDISSSLFEAIEGSSISLIIFSENYASSRWCLEELVKILECNEKYGQIVIPVFYKVDPSDVRHQKKSYEITLLELEKKYGFPKVLIWREALNKSANLSGITSSKFENEADLLEEIIHCVLMSMPKYPVNTKGLIGMEKPIAHLEPLLCRESKEARVIGIWGMSGIGKTTIAEEIFDKKHLEYEGYCFLEKVKDELEKHGIRSLKEKLFSTLLGDSVKIDTPNRLPSDIKRRIGRMKVLIVLDDVNDTDEVENIFGNLDWLHSGSRIIITTRDKQVLISNKADDDDIYSVGELSSSEALKLFNLSAFKKTHTEMEYYDLSQRVVNYAKGVPLVLKVLGCLLCGKPKEAWESQLDKLKKMPIKKVHDVMRLSYDDLDRKEKNILLDIACIFNGMDMKVGSLIRLLKDHENDNSALVGLERLKDRALVTISKKDLVSMHDIIQEMGREIVRQESEDPGCRSRLWDHEDIHEVLENNKGTEAIRGIKANSLVVWNPDLRPDIFVKMSKLQFLLIQWRGHTKRGDLLPKCFEVWPTNLKYLLWPDCPLKSLPECFPDRSLVRLELPRGQMQRLWNGVKDLVNLKQVVLVRCSFLEELPDFSKAINIESLIADHCVKLKSIHPSIYSLNKLQILELEGCVSLTEFTSDNRSKSLRNLDLGGCTSLRKLSVASENVKGLCLEGVPLNALPSSFACESKLEILDIRGTKYERLPSSFKNLTRLRCLGLASCAELQSIPVLPPTLEILSVGPCRSLRTVLFPSMTAEQFKENRKMIRFWNCRNLDERSLRDIGLNARINLMKFTHQHSPTPKKYGHGKDEHDFQAWHIYPGQCSVPKWLEYKTRNDEMIIDLSPAKLSHLLGFIFCFILTGEDSTEYFGPVKFEITISDGKKGYVMDSRIATDHLCLIYDKKCSHYLTSATENQTRFKIKVATQKVKSEMGRVMNLKLIEFGVSPIYALTYDSFIRQMNFFDSINKCKHIMLSIILCILIMQMKMKNLLGGIPSLSKKRKRGC